MITTCKHIKDDMSLQHAAYASKKHGGFRICNECWQKVMPYNKRGTNVGLRRLGLIEDAEKRPFVDWKHMLRIKLHYCAKCGRESMLRLISEKEISKLFEYIQFIEIENENTKAAEDRQSLIITALKKEIETWESSEAVTS